MLAECVPACPGLICFHSCHGIRPRPFEPLPGCACRVAVTAQHSEADLQKLVAALKSACKRVLA